ncbi:MAG: NAD(+)/NADH kinase, partial [Methanomassiliicoccales archaeon]|nr:NAD(+)/NADH kinase [Methanomassiliicoccales archaeon]
MRVGLVINPIAGMGGRVGLKGTDGDDTLLESIGRGAVSAVEDRAFESLKFAGPLGEYEFLTVGGNMGEELLLRTEAEFEVVYVPENPSSANDTRMGCKKVVDLGGQILLFAGGDGTARDVLDAIDERIPVIGIPSGVKMHSGVFSTNPEAAGRLLRLFASGSLPVHRAEVMDI